LIGKFRNLYFSKKRHNAKFENETRKTGDGRRETGRQDNPQPVSRTPTYFPCFFKTKAVRAGK
jgi:hypothetical protein